MYTENDILTIGESLIELSSQNPFANAECFNKFYGGDTLASAIAALRAGSKVGYITKVGNDYFGEYLLDAWQAEGLDISQVKLTNGVNGVYFVSREKNSSQTTYYRKKTAATQLGIDDINLEYVKSSRLVYATGFVQSLSLSCAEVVKKVFECAKENNIKCAYDVNFSKNTWSEDEAKEGFEDICNYIDILFLNTQKDAGVIFGLDSVESIITKIQDLGIKTAVINENNKNIWVLEGSSTIKFPFPDVQSLDTTGSKAVFNGVFMSCILNGHDIPTGIKQAFSYSSLQMQKIGAIKSIPTKKEAIEFYREHYE